MNENKVQIVKDGKLTWIGVRFLAKNFVSMIFNSTNVSGVIKIEDPETKIEVYPHVSRVKCLKCGYPQNSWDATQQYDTEKNVILMECVNCGFEWFKICVDQSTPSVPYIFINGSEKTTKPTVVPNGQMSLTIQARQILGEAAIVYEIPNLDSFEGLKFKVEWIEADDTRISREVIFNTDELTQIGLLAGFGRDIKDIVNEKLLEKIQQLKIKYDEEQ